VRTVTSADIILIQRQPYQCMYKNSYPSDNTAGIVQMNDKVHGNISYSPLDNQPCQIADNHQLVGTNNWNYGQDEPVP